MRVGRSLDGDFILNPTYEQIAESDLDLVVAGTKEAITMVEAGANEVPKTSWSRPCSVAQEVIRRRPRPSRAGPREHGKEKQQFEEPEENPFLAELREQYLDRIKDAHRPDRTARARHDGARRAARGAHRGARRGGRSPRSWRRILALEKEAFRELYLKDRKRTDLRAMDEIRPTTAEVGVLPRVHGTGLFTRGETQVLSSLALADLGLAQRLDTIEPQTGKRYMHHYNFPPYSTGETGQARQPEAA